MAFSKLTVTLFKAGFGSSSSTLFSTYNGARKKKVKTSFVIFFSIHDIDTKQLETITY